MLGNHLFGIYEKAFCTDDPWKVRLEKVKTLGFDYLEISIDESDLRLSRLDWDSGEVEALRRQCYDAGVGIQSMCLSAHRRFPFGSADPAVRKRAHEILEKALDLATGLGIRVIQLAGYDVYYEPSTPETVRLFREAMVWAAKKAEQKQVMLAMEVMDTPFMNSISKHMGYEAMIRSPWYKVYPDVGNLSAWTENDVDYEIARGADSIVAVHLKDTLAVTDTFGGRFKSVPFGAGCVDFVRRVRQLEQIGYTGPYMMEMWYAEGTDDCKEVASAKVWMETQYRAAMEKECTI